MKRAPLLLALAATAALLWHSATPAQACTYAVRTPEEYVAEADTIVVGSVTGYRELPNRIEEAGSARYVTSRIAVTVEVQRYLKGSGPPKIAVEEEGSCEFFLTPNSVGGEYLLMLNGEHSPFTLTGFAGGSLAIANPYQPRPNDVPFLTGFIYQQYDVISPIVAITGPGIEPATSNAPVVPFAIAAVALPLAFVLAASFLFPPKGSRM